MNPGELILEFECPALTKSEANMRAKTLKAQIIKSDRVAKQRSDVALVLRSYLQRRAYAHLAKGWPLPLRITLTRLAPVKNQLRDDDNIRASLKAVRDGVSDAIGVDDRIGGGLRFLYKQEPGHWAVRVRIERDVEPISPAEWDVIISTFDTEIQLARFVIEKTMQGDPIRLAMLESAKMKLEDMRRTA